MACLSPILCVNPRYRKEANKVLLANGVPDDYWLYVPCSTCFACLKKKASDWRVRLIHEATFGSHKTSSWVTLTLANEHYERFKHSPASAIRLFLERLRKRLGHSIRHWFITELGEDNQRLHFHGFVFDLKCTYSLFRELWGYGFVYISYISHKRIGYACKYAQKTTPDIAWFRPQIFCSSGLGKSYCLKNSHFHIAELVQNDRHNVLVGCYRCSMPRFYKDKIFGKARLLAYRKYFEANPPPFSTFVGKMSFSDPIAAREYRDFFYRETLSVKSSLPHSFYKSNNSSLSKSVNYGTLSFS